MKISEGVFIDNSFSEVIVPAVAETQIWINRSGKEVESQLWNFQDKGNREVTLIPEVTALLKDIYDNDWIKKRAKPIRIFYVSKCYRYERPQKGRYREFTQMGIEILGPDDYEEEAKELLKKCLDSVTIPYEWSDKVQRGLSYYKRDGFEALCPQLGAQKQIAGGGSYENGCGWAIGIDRVVLQKMENGNG